MESMVRNYKDKNQTITIRDPNSGSVVTIPMVKKRARGATGIGANFQAASRN